MFGDYIQIQHFLKIIFIGVCFEEAEESFLMQNTYTHIFDSKKVSSNIEEHFKKNNLVIIIINFRYLKCFNDSFHFNVII